MRAVNLELYLTYCRHLRQPKHRPYSRTVRNIPYYKTYNTRNLACFPQ